ncbi:hypothetical protein Pla52o_56680 [Novipirellula galeiformis]|uniref:Uncharacterized protein n=1 Tax=Novipirellula galeiformis TaxID=2528004 RepID=A0A5C6BGG2_9BACT|nr:hypothetical protein Pla52o_56680 [Novipirellula galeiformis]
MPSWLRVSPEKRWLARGSASRCSKRRVGPSTGVRSGSQVHACTAEGSLRRVR